MKYSVFAFAVVLLGFAPLPLEVKVVIDRNTGTQATPQFKFEHVPSPVKDDAGAHAKLELVVGDRDGSGAGLSALTDGALPASGDDPSSNFFFAAGTDGGRILMDLGDPIDIAEVNTYSWHAGTRGAQVFNLYVADGTEAKFNLKPDENTDPASCGWKLLATVDTRPEHGSGGGQYGVSIAGTKGSLGKFRYLLFDTVPTEIDDPFGNTFLSEIDVVAKK